MEFDPFLSIKILSSSSTKCIPLVPILEILEICLLRLTIWKIRITSSSKCIARGNGYTSKFLSITATLNPNFDRNIESKAPTGP